MLTPEQRQIVKEARDLITEPARWCRHTMAQRAGGIHCGFDDRRAEKYCALGALAVCILARAGMPTLAFERASSLAMSLTTRDRIEVVNDTYGHAAVLALFDQALAD